MESTNTRVLAYQLAQIIPDDTLQDISGGGFQMTPEGTFGQSGPHGEMDVSVDFRMDM